MAQSRIAPHRGQVVSDVAARRSLAAAVLRLALCDARGDGGRGGTERDRADARAFLAGGPLLEFWCAVADVEPEVLGRRSA